jgi:UDP-glucuronate 4-epimerase
MTILVTGAAGFIGYHLAHALMGRGERVVGIDNLNDYYDPALKHARLAALRDGHGNSFAFEQVDFGDAQALDEFARRHHFDRIAHLGAQAGVGYSLVNPQAYARSNLLGHVNLLELARARSVGHLVYASSSSVYGGNESLPFRVEDRVDNPVSLYAATKKADELMSESYAHLFRIAMTGHRR